VHLLHHRLLLLLLLPHLPLLPLRLLMVICCEELSALCPIDQLQLWVGDCR
jgi:hypothetical protein